MPVASPLAPKSALCHRPIGQVAPTRQLPRVPRSSRRGQTQEPPYVRVTSRPAVSTQHPHWLVWLGVGMCFSLTAVLFGQIVVGWVTVTWDDWHYGRPRTFQCDTVVGHGDSLEQPSHFIALNLHGNIEVIELSGGEASRTRVYQGPQLYGPGADLVVVTLQFPDPGQTHHPDLLMVFQGTQVVLHHVDGSFRHG